MQFAHPEMLWGLGLLCIPLAIHLFAFRRFKTVYFSNVAWLREIRQEQSSVRNLRKWLLLLLRMLAITALVLAFARPEFEGASSSAAAGMREMAIVIDNSPSMQSMAGPLSRFELARQQAIALVKQRNSGYSFRLYTTDGQFGGASVFDPASAIAALESLRPGNDIALLNELQPGRFQNTLSEVFYFSDFQRSGGLPTADSACRVVLVQTGGQKTENISIDSAWMAEPLLTAGKPQTLLIKSRNHRDAEAEVRLSVRQGKAGKQEKLLLFKPAEIRTDTLSISFATSGWQEIELSVDDPAASYDNVFRLAVQVSGIPGLFAQAGMQASPAARALLSSGLLRPSAVLPEKGGVVLASSSAADWNALLQASDKGCNVILFCDAASAPSAWTDRIPIAAAATEKTSLSCNAADWKQPFFADVLRRVSDELEMPVIERHIKLSINDPSRAEVVLRLENGDPLLIRLRMPNADFWILATGLSAEDGGLSRHVLFAPLMFKLAFSGPSSAQSAGGKFISVSQLTSTADETPFRLSGQGGEWIPRVLLRGKQMAVTLEDLSLTPGFYSLNGPQDSMRVAVNVAAAESEQDYFDEEELKRAGELLQIEDMSRADVLSAQASIAYWKYLLLFAVLMLVAETAVIRLMPA